MTTDNSPRTNTKSDYHEEVEKLKAEINARFIKAVGKLLISNKRDVTRNELAKEIRMHYQTLSAIMNEREGNNATTTNLAFLCKKYQVRPDYLLLGEEPMFEGGSKPEGFSKQPASNIEAELRMKHLQDVNDHLQKMNDERSELVSELKEQIKYYKERLAKCEAS